MGYFPLFIHCLYQQIHTHGHPDYAQKVSWFKGKYASVSEFLFSSSLPDFGLVLLISLS